MQVNGGGTDCWLTPPTSFGRRLRRSENEVHLNPVQKMPNGALRVLTEIPLPRPAHLLPDKTRVSRTVRALMPSAANADPNNANPDSHGNLLTSKVVTVRFFDFHLPNISSTTKAHLNISTNSNNGNSNTDIWWIILAVLGALILFCLFTFRSLNESQHSLQCYSSASSSASHAAVHSSALECGDAK